MAVFPNLSDHDRIDPLSGKADAIRSSLPEELCGYSRKSRNIDSSASVVIVGA